MVKAVIFDFFGVLTVRGTESFRHTFYPNSQEKLARHQKIQDELNRGQISYDEFIDGLSEIGGVDRETVLKHTEEYEPNLELLEYIRQRLKPGCKIGIISNAGADWVLKIIGEENEKLFDDIILSYKVGLIKPEPEIYEMSARNLDVNEEECVFVDDILNYCQGAESVGMSTIWYQSFEQFRAEMGKLLPPVSDN